MAAAAAIGIGSAEFDAFAARAAALPGSVVTGLWLVVAGDLCRILFPAINSGLSLDDAEVRANLLAVDAYAGQGQPGCFLNGDGLGQGLQDSRGWGVERVWAACLQLVGAGLQAGEMAFHLDDPLRMPGGGVVTTGTCRDAEGMDVFRAGVLRMAYLDGLIRHSRAKVACGDGAKMVTFDRPDFMVAATRGRYQNAWGGLELTVMAMAAGWFEGHSLTHKGMPRPPLCHVAGD